MLSTFFVRLAFAVLLCASTAACGASPATPIDPGLPAFAALATPAMKAHWTVTSLGRFGDPHGVAVNPECVSNCDVYVADPGQKRIWKVSPDGSKTSIGDFSSVGGDFYPQAVAISPIDFSVWIADEEPIGKLSIVWHVHRDGTTSRVGGWTYPPDSYARGIAAGPNGEIYLAVATRNHLFGEGRIECQGPTGACLAPTILQKNSFGITISQHKLMFSANAGEKQVWWGAPNSSFKRFCQLDDPFDVAIAWSGAGPLFVADHGSKRVWRIEYNNSGPTHLSYIDFADPYGVAVDQSGTVYVADAGSKNVWKLTP